MSWFALDRDGARLRGIDVGKGLAVVFQHGLGGDEAQVADVFPEAGNLRRLTLECRGQGQSAAGAAADFSIKNFADDVLAFADARGVEKFAVGGISMGAAIALNIAVRHPRRVTALVLARPAWLWDTAPPNMRAYAEIAGHLARPDICEATPYGDAPPPLTVGRATRRARPSDPHKGEGDFASPPQCAHAGDLGLNNDVSVSLPLVGRGQGWGCATDETSLCDNSADRENALADFEASALAGTLAREAPDNLATLKKFFAVSDRKTLAALLAAIAADGPGVSEAEVGAISVPTLVIGHRVDAFHPFAFAETLSAKIPGARMLEITPKALDKARYTAEFRAGLAGFLATAGM